MHVLIVCWMYVLCFIAWCCDLFWFGCCFYLCNSVASYYFRYLVVLILELLVYLGLDTVCFMVAGLFVTLFVVFRVACRYAFVCVSFTCLRLRFGLLCWFDVCWILWLLMLCVFGCLDCCCLRVCCCFWVWFVDWLSFVSVD